MVYIRINSSLNSIHTWIWFFQVYVLWLPCVLVVNFQKNLQEKCDNFGKEVSQMAKDLVSG